MAWLNLVDPNVLGVTWFGSGIFTGPEADMALNTDFTWSDDVSGPAGTFDVETVLLHEIGHVLFLGHSNDPGSVMQPFYGGVDRDLGTDDIEGITFLYDSNITGSVSGTVINTSGKAIKGATVVLEGASLGASTKGKNGTYNITNVPDPVTYTITASKDGFESSTVRLTVSGSEILNFVLTPIAGEGGGGGGNGKPPKCHPKKGC